MSGRVEGVLVSRYGQLVGPPHSSNRELTAALSPDARHVSSKDLPPEEWMLAMSAARRRR